jgi:hypothetical protein
MSSREARLWIGVGGHAGDLQMVNGRLLGRVFSGQCSLPLHYHLLHHLCLCRCRHSHMEVGKHRLLWAFVSPAWRWVSILIYRSSSLLAPSTQPIRSLGQSSEEVRVAEHWGNREMESCRRQMREMAKENKMDEWWKGGKKRKRREFTTDSLNSGYHLASLK